MSVPFVDLHAQYLTLREEIDAAIRGVIEETAFIGGPRVKAFEQGFARELGVEHVIGVANGTDALFVAMKMLGIGEGDEVITTATSWIASSETISQTGARPVFVDISADHYTIDETRIEAAITQRTRAILPVHLYGQMAKMDAIMEIARDHDLLVIEDCAQSHFSKYEGRFAGTFGDVATFSFYPGKNLGAYGDAGAIVTADDALARLCRMFANHGQLQKHRHEMEGINSRLDGLQAAVLGAKLPHIHRWNELRIQHAERYRAGLDDVEWIRLPAVRPDTVHTFHVFAIRTPDRESLQAHLKELGIATAVHYPVALPLMPAYRAHGHTPDDFPEAYRHQQEELSLPLYPEMGEAEISAVIEGIRSWTP